MDLYLVRHALSTENRKGRLQVATTELAAEGLAQAERTGRWLARYFAARELPVAALYSSDMRRAWHTAEIIGRHLGLPPIPEPGLREKYAGLAEGLTRAECAVRFPDSMPGLHDPTDLDWAWPGGETRREFLARVLPTLDAITARHRPGDQVVVVSHGGPIRAYLNSLTRRSQDLTDADFTHDVRNCSVTHVHFPTRDEGLDVACVLAHNQTGHLDDPLEE
jgi:broad specificity phosphatase PhoE